jgi:tetratricopeptide (TPR) repeat protein
MRAILPCLLALVLPLGAGPREGGGLAKAIADAERALAANDVPAARAAIERVLERDPHSPVGWQLSERCGEAANDADERVYALHRQLALARAQKADKATLDALRARLLPLDPAADKLAKVRTGFVERLTKLAETYEKAKRPHSAIRAFKQALALDPDRADVAQAIERIAAAPDPSLAEDARPRDLLEGISAEWIRAHDEEHSKWSERAVLEKPNYVTQTTAGYAVLVRAAEAMEQMNAFYRIFFRYGDKATPRIFLNIFQDRDEYLRLGEGPPVEWSGGHYTGSAVETFITAAGFEDTVGTLFHEAAHQFVDLSTNAAGWLNEGMASFFEGARILANGTVLMNLPANHRLFPLAARMEKGWMTSASDGIDPDDPNKEPETSPTLRIVIENQYEWGPAWYEPTWGLVYFLYNFQDRTDGRFLYRKAFGDYVDATGGKTGDSAVQAFEEVVLANPAPPTPGIEETTGALPRTVDEINAVWKDYIVDLRDRQSGVVKETPPYLDWAHNAVKRDALDDAAEFFEKALQAAPTDVDVLAPFAEFLSKRKDDDRASKLLTQALAVVENTEPVDEARIAELEKQLRKTDPSYQRLSDLRTALVADVKDLVERYLEAGLNLQAMDVAFHLGAELQEPSLFAYYERGVQAEGRSIARWRLAYDEESLDGWNSAGLETVFEPAGEHLLAKLGTYTTGVNDYAILTLDELTSGDYSLECEVEAQHGRVNFAGLVFGRKSAQDCHALILYPPAPGKNGFVNLVTFYGSGAADTWRRNPVQHADKEAADPTRTRSDGAAAFYKLRIDVTGRLVDVWVDGQFQATQEFPSLDILRGTFGLITGRGEARFRNVRFLARHPRDPSGAIERKLTVEAAQSGDEAVNGSWLGRVPPFPTAQRWLQEPRSSWAEGHGAPQLLVLWSTEQNDQVQIDDYLRDLAEKHAAIGLKVVNVLAFWNEALAEEHLRAHPFPGAVALDTPTQAERNFGITFERFDVERFHLPRFILLDIDGKVAWEGDPGFAKDVGWEGEESLLDVPLRELIAKRRLSEFVAWRDAWPAARAALERGDFASAAGALAAAAVFDATVSPEVAEAVAIVAALEGAAGGLEALGAQLAEDGREPALEVLVDWCKALKLSVPKSKPLNAVLKSPSIAAWKRVPTLLKPAIPKVGKDESAVKLALEKVAALPGSFPAEVLEEARALAAAGDKEAFAALVESCAERPARWLAADHFGW